MAKNTLSINIPEINNQELTVDIIGRTPLLVKRFDEKTQQGIEDAQQGVAKRKKDPRKPEEECERARIRNVKGEDCVKAIWIKKGMAAMGGYFGIPRGNIEQGVYVVGDLLPIKHSGKKPIMNTARVRVGQGGMAKTSVAYRPEFQDWKCLGVRIGFDASVLTAHQVISLLNHAGGKNGIGEWRPQKGGDYGRFDVVPAGASKKLIEDMKRNAPKATNVAMPMAAASAAPKKIGRPKKEPILVVDADAPKKRGRPKKSESDGLVANKVLRRGRPPKNAPKSKDDALAQVEALRKQWGV